MPSQSDFNGSPTLNYRWFSTLDVGEPPTPHDNWWSSNENLTGFQVSDVYFPNLESNPGSPLLQKCKIKMNLLALVHGKKVPYTAYRTNAKAERQGEIHESLSKGQWPKSSVSQEGPLPLLQRLREA